MKLVLLGAPGAGKGTHAKVMSEKHSLNHLATGDILRKNIREATELGVKAKDTIESGGLVSDDLINAMMADEIKKIGFSKGFILDGYPRTIGQAEALDKFLEDNQSPLDVVLSFENTEAVLIDRLSGRRVCPKCGSGYHIRNMPPKNEGVCDDCGSELIQRKDDHPDTIRNRFENYKKETAPLVGYYNKKGTLKNLTADLELDELQAEIEKLFEELKLVP